MLVFLFYLTQVSQVYGEFDKDSINTLIAEALKCYPKTAAFAVSAVQDGNVIYNEAFGKASIEKDIKATTNTRFSIGSISKGFTAYMVGSQVAQDHYSWQDKITDIFRKFNVKMSLQGEFRNKACSLEDMLSHKTGIKSYDLLLSLDNDVTRQQWVTQYLPKFEQMFEMRSEFYYNNWFYTLAGYLIEVVGGSLFEEQVKNTMFDPLGMTDTCFVSDKTFDDLTEQELSRPYKEGSDGTLYPIPISALKLISPHSPAGGIISTSTDMAKYMIGVIDGYNYEEGAILSGEVLESITQPKMLMGIQLGDSVVIQKPRYPESFLDKGYAFGHIIGTYRGLEYVNHGGSTYGHYSYLTLIPAKNVGVFTVISGDDYHNRDNFRMQRLVQLYLIDVMLGETPWLDASKICSFPDPPEKRAGDPPPDESWEPVANPGMYVGNYSNPVFPVIELSKDGSNLRFKMGGINGTVTKGYSNRYTVILNMPVDPLGLPDADKQTASLSFLFDEQDFKVSKLYLHWGAEGFEFSGTMPQFTKYYLVLLALFCLLT